MGRPVVQSTRNRAHVYPNLPPKEKPTQVRIYGFIEHLQHELNRKNAFRRHFGGFERQSRKRRKFESKYIKICQIRIAKASERHKQASDCNQNDQSMSKTSQTAPKQLPLPTPAQLNRVGLNGRAVVDH